MSQSLSQKILIIDDEISMQRLLKISLEPHGYIIELARNGKEGIALAVGGAGYSAILLDLGLPDLNGIDVLATLRAKGIKTPILVLTVMEDDESKVTALDLGADDYLTKPFSIPELLARIRVAIRHSTAPQVEARLIKTGPIEIDISAHQVRINSTEIKLTPIEFQILTVLGLSLGKVVTHRVLLNKIWGPNSVEHVQYLRVHLGQIRKKLKEHGAEDLLMTEAGVGYRLAMK